RQAASPRLRAGPGPRGWGWWAKAVLLSSCARAGGGGRAEASDGQAYEDRIIGLAVLCRAWPGWGCLPLRRIHVRLWHRDRTPGDSPARRLHGGSLQRGYLSYEGTRTKS